MAALRRLIPAVANSARITVRKQSTAIVADSEKASLLKKAEGPWGEMSIVEKTNLYRAVYKSTRLELMSVSTASQVNVWAMVAGAVAVSYGCFSLIHAKIVGPTPHTMTAEYKAIEDIKQKDKNPITGYGTLK